jgi:hypothetical protein
MGLSTFGYGDAFLQARISEYVSTLSYITSQLATHLRNVLLGNFIIVPGLQSELR